MTDTQAAKPQPEPRSAYRAFRTITTRWMDNDASGHVNNVVYSSWFDTVVNAHLHGQTMSAAKGHFIHVYVARADRRPVELSAQLKTVLEALH